jgi:molybdate transport system regulatory protein
MPAARQPVAARKPVGSRVPSAAYASALGQSTADKRVEILRQVARTGSISQAARDTGVSYKAAWQAIDTLTNLAGVSLVERAVGGVGGGGARITAAGVQLLAAADALNDARGEVLARLKGQARRFS